METQFAKNGFALSTDFWLLLLGRKDFEGSLYLVIAFLILLVGVSIWNKYNDFRLRKRRKK